MIIDHNNIEYIGKRDAINQNRFNGAFYYSKEIVRNIIPRVKTSRNWITVNVQGLGASHSIVFIHNNKHPENYEWLAAYEDLILVCGIPETCEKVAWLGRTIYLPLSIDVAEVEKYKQPKTREICFAGRKTKRKGVRFPEETDFIEGVSREVFLTRLAKYKKAYAVGRAALEAKALGCEVLPYDERFPDPDVWTVLDNKDAAKILQEELNKAEGEK